MKIAPAAFRLLAKTVPRLLPDGTPERPPASRSEHGLAHAAYAGFCLSLVTTLGVVIGLLTYGTGQTWLGWAKIVLGVLMAAEGFLLARDWRGARSLTLWRIRKRGAVRPAPPSLRRRLAWLLASPVLGLLGIAWLALGTLTAALGVSGLV